MRLFSPSRFHVCFFFFPTAGGGGTAPLPSTDSTTAYITNVHQYQYPQLLHISFLECNWSIFNGHKEVEKTRTIVGCCGGTASPPPPLRPPIVFFSPLCRPLSLRGWSGWERRVGMEGARALERVCPTVEVQHPVLNLFTWGSPKVGKILLVRTPRGN